MAPLLALASVALATALDLGVYGPLTSCSQQHLAAVVAFDLDLRKNFESHLRERFGDPVVEVPFLHEGLRNVSVRLGTSHGEPEVGMATSLDLLLGSSGDPVAGIVGGLHSSIAVNVATLCAAMKVPQIAYGATSPALSNKQIYPYFLRTVPPDTIQAKAFWAFIVVFQLPLAACLYSLEPYGEGLFRAIEEEALRAGAVGRFRGVGFRLVGERHELLQGLLEVKNLHTRFLFLALSSSLSPIMLPLMREQGMLAKGWQLLSSEAGILYAPLPVGFMQWRPVNVGRKLDGFLRHWSRLRAQDVLSSEARARYKIDLFRVPLEQATVPGITDESFQEELEIFTPFLFDALYTFVMAINALLRQGHALESIRGELLLDQLKVTEFEGISGPIGFDANLDREAVYYELLNLRPEGQEVAGMYTTSNEQLTTGLLYWMTGNTSFMPPQELLDCGPGLYVDEASRQCLPCTRGFFCQGGAQKQCPRGQFANVSGRASCVSCPPGRFSSDLGSTLCTACLAGFYAPAQGMEACEKCPKGTYVPYFESDRCLECSMGQETAERGSQSASDCRCAFGSYMCNSSMGCRPCPEGLLCQAGLGLPLQEAGFWADPSGAEMCRFEVLRCRNALECPGRSVLGGCAPGRIGTACNNCKENFFPNEDGSCDQCGLVDFFPSLMTICLLALVSLTLARTMRNAERLSLNTLTVVAVSGQMVVAVQALSSIRQLSIRWMSPVGEVMALTQLLSFDFDLVKISCLYGQDSPLFKFVGQLLVCPVAMAILFGNWLICYSQKVSKDALINSCGNLVFALLISITLAVLDPFQCVLNPDGSSSMASNPGIRCFASGEHSELLGFAIVGIICYPVSIITWATYTTLKYPSRVHSGEGLQLVNRHRFLFQRFKPERYYYGLVLLARSVLLALIPSLFIAAPEVQMELMGVVLISACALQVRLWPWRSDLANYVDLLINCLLQVLFLGVAPLTRRDEDLSKGLLGWVLVTAVLSPVVFGFVGIGYALWRHFQPAQSFGIFLCHHKGCAGSLSRLLKILVKQHSSTEVFLDSDQLEDIDLVFEIIRKRTRNVVVILTPELLKRMWCAGELVTAFKNKVHTLPLVCDGYIPPFDQLVSHVEEVWTVQEKQILFHHGISMEDVASTYGWLQTLEGLELARFARVEDQELIVVEMLHHLRVPRNLFQPSLAAHRVKARILITGAVSDAEALAALEIFQILVLRRMQRECVVVRSSRELLAYRPWAYYLVVLLSRGLLSDPRFAQTLLSVYLGEHARHLELVAVHADSSFQFPSPDFFQEVKEKGLGAGCDVISPSLGPELAVAYRSLLNILALPLSPNGSEGLLDEQCRGICARFRRYSSGNGSLMDSQDDLQVPGDGVDTRSLRTLNPRNEILDVFTTEMKRNLFRLGRSGTWTETGDFELEEMGGRLSKIAEDSEEEPGWSPDSLGEVLELQGSAIGVSLIELEKDLIEKEDLIEL